MFTFPKIRSKILPCAKMSPLFLWDKANFYKHSILGLTVIINPNNTPNPANSRV